MRTNWIKTFASGLLACALLASCSDEVVNEPTELQDINAKFELNRIWKSSIGNGDDGKFNSLAPAVWEDKVIVSDVNGLVTAYERTSGKTLWEVNLEQPVSGGVTANAGVIALGTKNAEVFVLDVNNGNQLWKSQVSSEVLAKPAIDDGKLVVRTGDGKIFAMNLTDGKQEWFYDRVIPNLTLRGTSAPVAIGGIVLTGFANGKLAAFNLNSGDLLWEQRISAPRGSSEISRIVDVDATPVVYGSTLYAAGYNGFAIALDLNNGRYLWREEASITKPVLVDERHVYIITTDGEVAALDRFSGEPVWQIEDLMYRSLTAATDNGEYIIVGDAEGYLHWLEKSSGEIVAREKLDDYGVSTAVMSTDQEIIATSRYGYLYVFDNPVANDETQTETVE